MERQVARLGAPSSCGKDPRVTLAVRRTAFPSRVTVVVLLGVAAGLVFAHRLYRTAEISTCGAIPRAGTSCGPDVIPDRQTVYCGLGSDTPLGLRMTPECTSAFLVLPLIVVG